MDKQTTPDPIDLHVGGRLRHRRKREVLQALRDGADREAVKTLLAITEEELTAWENATLRPRGLHALEVQRLRRHRRNNLLTLCVDLYWVLPSAAAAPHASLEWRAIRAAWGMAIDSLGLTEADVEVRAREAHRALLRGPDADPT